MTADRFWDETTKAALGWAEVWGTFQPVSKPGSRYKRGVRPFLPGEAEEWRAAMQDWQALLGCLADTAWRKGLTELLRELPDCEAVLHLVSQGAALRQVDFFEMKAFLWRGWQVERLLVEKGVHVPWWVAMEWETLLRKLNLPGEIVPAFSLADAGDPVLVALQEEVARLEGAIFAAKKEQADRLRTRYGRGPSREGQYVWERQARFVAEAAVDAELRLVQENVFEAVYQVVPPPEFAEWQAERERKLVEVEDREVVVLQHLVQAFRPHAERMLAAFAALARLDWALAKADVARKWDGCAAVWLDAAQEQRKQTENASWRVIGGWHPVAREAVERRGGAYTRLDLELQRGVGLITGPNMGGKTVVLKTFGLLQALAQHAVPVPAEGFYFLPVERIGLSGGDEQSLVSGLSSFGGEMQRIAGLLRAAGRALLLLDEVARTTNPEEGEALAIGLATYLAGSVHTALFASHFPRVAQVAGLQSFRVAGLREEVLAELEQGATGDVLQKLQSAMEYRLLKNEGQDVPKQAVRLAQCFGLPEAVLATTRAVLQEREEGQSE